MIINVQLITKIEASYINLVIIKNFIIKNCYFNIVLLFNIQTKLPRTKRASLGKLKILSNYRAPRYTVNVVKLNLSD